MDGPHALIGGQLCRKFGEGEVVERREVRSGRRRPGEVEILAGLSEGDRVITEGTQKVRDGAVVRLVESPTG